MEMKDEEISQIVKELDFTGNGRINYSEFIAATIDREKLLTADKLQAIFKSFDRDNSGEITSSNIREAFSKIGKNISD